MAFTQQEEDILRLMIAETQTRMKADLVRIALKDDVQANVEPLNIQISNNYQANIDAANSANQTATKSLMDYFKV